MKAWWAGLMVVMVGLVIAFHALAADPLRVKSDQWLEVRRPTGQVIYSRGQTSQPVHNGMRLKSVGDTITTKQASSVVLGIDRGTGFVKVAENTTITVQKLETGNKGQRITELQVLSGQVNLQVRPLTHNASRVEIKTPAGVAGVRGTEFGVSVQNDGKMGVGTKKGAVATSAQGQTVLVKAGFQNLTIPGQPPSAAVPLREDTRLNVTQLLARDRQVQIVGTVDPVNLLLINQQPQNVNSNGRFDITVPLPSNRKLEATVLTPLGTKQLYQLVVP
ncbi:FecR domain-containing protein [Komarekiella sp. 'clone 1']|uniref:FecR domain-containing protein n=1 Tax=Komarekiella delphini-convector SJRDD-AB1 TaxID=2593771 RepID=A0AA40T326_9NOST|nr:FecR family protein [Komarekiella delphini-convector]MBD6619798.1 FecR domain-containing protein [Komarekiella delphini-convector SJRDD-AB1]